LKVIAAAYLVLFSVLLLTTAPIRIGMAVAHCWHPPVCPCHLGHLIGFLLLTLLALAPRWPVPRWGAAAMLLAYAVGTECLQVLVPGRVCDPVDCAENLAGIAAGCLICSLPRSYMLSHLAPGE